MATVDWIFLGVLLFSMVVGAWRGLVYELISLASWFVAFVLAQWFAPDVAKHLPMAGAGEALRYAAGFVVVFVGSLFAGSLIAFVLKKLISAVGMSPADRALGALFGVVRGAVLLLAVVLVVGMTPLHTGSWWQEATGPRVANVVLSGLKPVLPQEFGKYLP
ncbi:CvpA family protein [Curvibacter sp. APW13]|uniref:CvpA family protein n=1 Tax=Curvibacter sp. APW13 TaxID=3077236 RepID=UPI0028DF513B|nr:CvpA family protein [Curvibacter sp. APW13]MDT8990900.1 CvpA family protein [Curvibacter sp. APW13]